MKKVICTICLLLMLLSGCTERSLQWRTSSLGGLPLMTPCLYLMKKNIAEVNAMMKIDRETLAEDMKRKNPIYFMTKKETGS